MPKLIKNNELTENISQTLDKDFSGKVDEVLANKGTVLTPKEYWLENSEQLAGKDNIGIWLDSDEGPEELSPHIEKLSLIAINFPKFADGRGYSYARILRDRLGFKGELRAIGDIMHDQMFYLKRCGFNSFAVREDKNAEVVITGLNDFSECYQAATVQDKPLFRRR